MLSGDGGFLVVAASQLLLVFHASVLEPSLDLSFAQVQGVSKFHAFRCRQVALLLETAFQAVQLVIGEDGPRFPPTSLLRSGIGSQQGR